MLLAQIFVSLRAQENSDKQSLGRGIYVYDVAIEGAPILVCTVHLRVACERSVLYSEQYQSDVHCRACDGRLHHMIQLNDNTCTCVAVSLCRHSYAGCHFYVYSKLYIF